MAARPSVSRDMTAPLHGERKCGCLVRQNEVVQSDLPGVRLSDLYCYPNKATVRSLEMARRGERAAAAGGPHRSACIPRWDGNEGVCGHLDARAM